jgi:hypothetical protein
VTATGPRLSAGLKALDQRPSTGAIERYFYFSCCLLAALGDRAGTGGASPAALARNAGRSVRQFLPGAPVLRGVHMKKPSSPSTAKPGSFVSLKPVRA